MTSLVIIKTFVILLLNKKKRNARQCLKVGLGCGPKNIQLGFTGLSNLRVKP